MQYCQGHDHVHRERTVHDEGTYSVGSKIRRVFPDRIIIAVAAKRFHCAGVLLQRYFVGKGASRFYDTSLQMSRSVTVTSAKSCTTMSCVRWHDHVPRDC